MDITGSCMDSACMCVVCRKNKQDVTSETVNQKEREGKETELEFRLNGSYTDRRRWWVGGERVCESGLLERLALSNDLFSVGKLMCAVRLG